MKVSWKKVDPNMILTRQIIIFSLALHSRLNAQTKTMSYVHTTGAGMRARYELKKAGQNFYVTSKKKKELIDSFIVSLRFSLFSDLINRYQAQPIVLW